MRAKHEFQDAAVPPPTPEAPPAQAKVIGPPVVHPQADTLFFDAAPVFSHAAGVVSVTLTNRRHVPDGRGGVIEQEVVVGFLRCGMQGAQSLRQALDAATLLGHPTPGRGHN